MGSRFSFDGTSRSSIRGTRSTSGGRNDCQKDFATHTCTFSSNVYSELVRGNGEALASLVL
jgi:hypothetical protein